MTIACPCCGVAVDAPNVDILVDKYRLPHMEACVLRAVWRGKGYPVMAERIFDLMYADDPDGGPSPGQMYSTFKVSLSRLRKRIRGSGVSIENAGYRRGYRLVLGEKARENSRQYAKRNWVDEPRFKARNSDRCGPDENRSAAA
jgi:hypothetical protein